MNVFTVSFFGHREVENPSMVSEKLDGLLRELLRTKEYVELLVGRNGEFDTLVASAVKRAKRIHGSENSALVLVLPYMIAEYENNRASFEAFYDEIEICESSALSHPKSAIQIRNREMVDRADLIVCHITKTKGGAYKTLNYAEKQNKNVINL